MLDKRADVLLVRPVGARDDKWILPGCTARAVEEPRGVVRRAISADLGLAVPTGRVLLMDYAPATPHGYAVAGWDLVFECGLVHDAATITLAQGRLAAARFVSLDELDGHTNEVQGRRVRAALDALIAGYTAEFVRGHPVRHAIARARPTPLGGPSPTADATAEE